MTSLRLVSQDVLKAVVDYLDFDSIALLFWTFDKSLQRALVNGAIQRIVLEGVVQQQQQLYSAHFYALSRLKEIDTLKVAICRGPAMRQASPLLVNLAPRHLKMDITTPWLHPSLENAAFFQFIYTLQVSLPAAAIPTLLRCIPLLPPSLVCLQLTLSHSMGAVQTNLQELIQILPNTLLELTLKATMCIISSVTLSDIFKALPRLELLSFSEIVCSITECKVPDTLTSLTVTSLAVLKKASLSDSNLSILQLDTPTLTTTPQGNPYEYFELQQLLPPCLTQLRIPSLPCMENLPLQLTSLEVDCTNTESLGVLLDRLLLPTLSLHTLSVLLPQKPWSDPGFIARLPSSLTDLHIRVREDSTSPELISRIFGTSHVRLRLAMLSLPFSMLLDFVRNFPHAEIKVTPFIALTDEDVSQILEDVPEVAAILRECFELETLSVAIVKWLEKLGNGRIEMKLCECRKCVARWNLEQQTAKRITLLVVTGDIWGHLPQKHRILPPTVRGIRFNVSQRMAHQVYCLSHAPALSFTELLQLPTPLTLSVLDFDNCPLVPDAQFWASIPHSVTHLKSTHEHDPQVKFGGHPTRIISFFDPAKFTCHPLDLVTLETPYLLYTVNHLQLLFSSSTIRTLSATIRDEDVKIFEFGLCPTTAFPHLQNMSLRAIPTMTGMLIGNYHTHISLKSIQQEVIEILQLADIVTVGFVYADTLAIHQRATHLVLQDGSCHPAFSRLEYHRGDLLREIRGLLLAPQHDDDCFPPNVSSLDFAVKHAPGNRFLVVPHLPARCIHLRISQTFFDHSCPRLVLPTLPNTLETVVMKITLPTPSNWMGGRDPDVLPVEEQAPLPRLRSFETDYAEDRFLDALCRALPKTARVSVGTAIFTGLLLPSDVTHFSWKSAIALCLDLEKRFPQLEIGKWSACGVNLAIRSEQVTSVSFGLDFAIESLFDETTIHRKASIIPLIQDLIELQECVTLPVALPPSVTRLEFSVSRLFFQDEDLSAVMTTSPHLLRSHQLFRPKAKMPLPNVKHLILRPAALPKSSALHCTSLPPNLEVLNIAPTGNLHAARTLNLQRIKEGTPHLREVNATPMIEFGELEDGIKDKLTINTVQEVE